MAISRKTRLFLLILSFVLMVAGFLAAIPMNQLASLNMHLDTLSSRVKNNDLEGAEAAMRYLEQDYNYLTDLKMRYFADNYWFLDTYLRQAAIAYMAEDFDKFENILKGHEDDYRSHYMSGIYKFKLFQVAYQSAEDKEDVFSRAQDQLRLDFRRCVVDGPGIDKNFNCSFDYDLVSNPEKLKEALENPSPGRLFMLGRPMDGSSDSEENEGEMLNPLESRPNERGAGNADPQRGG